MKDLTSTKTITVSYDHHGTHIHALFHLSTGGLLERVDFKTGKNGSSEHEEFDDRAELINEMLKDGKSLERIQKVVGSRSIISRIIQQYQESVK